jgi:hypothetical protein
VNGLSWFWIGLMATVPPLVGALLALTCWRHSEMILGNIAGTTVIFGSAIALILREHVELDHLARACIDAGYVCLPVPGAFYRYAVYAFVGLIEVFVLFAVSLSVEQKMRRRGYDPEWR